MWEIKQGSCILWAVKAQKLFPMCLGCSYGGQRFSTSLLSIFFQIWALGLHVYFQVPIFQKMEHEPGARALWGCGGGGKGSSLFLFSFYGLHRNASQHRNFSTEGCRFRTFPSSLYPRVCVPVFIIQLVKFSFIWQMSCFTKHFGCFHGAFCHKKEMQFFKWFLSFSVNLGTKIKLTFPENKRCPGTQGHLLWNQNLCLHRAQFLLRNKHERPSAKEEQPPRWHILSLIDDVVLAKQLQKWETGNKWVGVIH